jgi:transposase InsO family protein
VSPATVSRYLARAGLVTPDPRKRPRSSCLRFAAELPNQCWQSDFTHYPLADNTGTEILAWLDDHSRCLLRITAHRHVAGPTVVTEFRAAVAEHGIPASTLTDGAVFTGLYRGRGWVALERELTALGIGLSHCRPYHPQTCGKVERFHQTLKKWLARQDLATTVSGLQAQLDSFTSYYNTCRPHRAVGRRTPAAAWNARPRAMPLRQGIRISEHFRVRRDRIDTDGKLTLRYNSRLHHIGIGRRWAGTNVLILARDLDLRIITQDDGQLIRQLTLDPSRDYQAQAPRV